MGASGSLFLPGVRQMRLIFLRYVPCQCSNSNIHQGPGLLYGSTCDVWYGCYSEKHSFHDVHNDSAQYTTVRNGDYEHCSEKHMSMKGVTRKCYYNHVQRQSSHLLLRVGHPVLHADNFVDVRMCSSSKG